MTSARLFRENNGLVSLGCERKALMKHMKGNDTALRFQLVRLETTWVLSHYYKNNSVSSLRDTFL